MAALPPKFSLGGSGLQPRKTRAWFSLPSPPNRGFTITVWKNLPPLLVVLLQAPAQGGEVRSAGSKAHDFQGLETRWAFPSRGSQSLLNPDRPWA